VKLPVVLALALGLTIALVYTFITHGTAQRHERLRAQLTVQEWLTELSREMAESSERKLFPNRAELERKAVQESCRPFDGVVRLSRQPSDSVRVLELGSRSELPFSVRGLQELKVETSGPVLLEYAVDDLTLYWLEKGRFYRQRRGARGDTELVHLNPDLPVDGLTFSINGREVRIAIEAGSFRAVQAVTVR
jgi:hypothetical protein